MFGGLSLALHRRVGQQVGAALGAAGRTIWHLQRTTDLSCPLLQANLEGCVSACQSVRCCAVQQGSSTCQVQGQHDTLSMTLAYSTLCLATSGGQGDMCAYTKHTFRSWATPVCKCRVTSNSPSPPSPDQVYVQEACCDALPEHHHPGLPVSSQAACARCQLRRPKTAPAAHTCANVVILHFQIDGMQQGTRPETTLLCLSRAGTCLECWLRRSTAHAWVAGSEVHIHRR